jgi:hypothetical protein
LLGILGSAQGPEASARSARQYDGPSHRGGAAGRVPLGRLGSGAGLNIGVLKLQKIFGFMGGRTEIYR